MISFLSGSHLHPPFRSASITIPMSTTKAQAVFSSSLSSCQFSCHMLHFSVLQVPTPITSMDISVKRVSSNDRQHRFQTFKAWFSCMSWFPFPPFPPASPVCGFSCGRGSGDAASLRDVWERLCRVLPGQGPLLRLGRLGVRAVLGKQQTPLPQTGHQTRKPRAAVFRSESEWWAAQTHTQTHGKR